MFPAILPPPCRPTARKSPRVAVSRFLPSPITSGRLVPASARACSTHFLCSTSSFSLTYTLFCINIKTKTLYPHCFHTLAHSTFWKLFVFNFLRTLFNKHGGGGLLLPIWNGLSALLLGFLRSLPVSSQLSAISRTSAPLVGPCESSETSALAIPRPAELEWCADSKIKDHPCR
jgi:hypothetical protein